MKGPLEGLRIAGFSWAWAVPYATTFMAMMGAESIRIESMKHPDICRLPPPFPEGKRGGINSSGFWNTVNPNNLSVSLDLTHPKGVELAKRLVKRCDIVVDNFSAGTMDRLGLGYEVLKGVKPDIIVLSSSACGATGPERHYHGYGTMHFLITGLSHITGYPDGPPEMVNTPYGDPTSAMHAGIALLAAVHHRNETGNGQFIDVSQFETTACLLGEAYLDYVTNGRVWFRDANRDRIMAPHGCYRCIGEDSWVTIAIATDQEWRAFCDAIGNPPWTNDGRFADGYLRRKNQDELDKLIEEWTKEYAAIEVTQMLQQVGLAAFPTYSVEDLVKDPHMQSRGLFVEVDHAEPDVGRRLTQGLPFRLSAIPHVEYAPAPLLGQHNEYVFGEILGMSRDEISQLVEERVLY